MLGMRILLSLLAAIPHASSFSCGVLPHKSAWVPLCPESLASSGLNPMMHRRIAALSHFPTTRSRLIPQDSTLSGMSMSSAANEILIVGGGPSGLAAGLELNKIINEENSGFPQSTITIVESMPSITNLDTEKAFSYLIGGAGSQFLDRHHLPDVEDQGVRGDTIFFTIVDGKDGSVKKNSLPFVDKSARPSYWHPREKFIGILADAFMKKVKENEQAGRGKLEFLQGWEMKLLNRDSSGSGHKLEVQLQSKTSGEQRKMSPWLVVGADGLKSSVRETLSAWAEEDGATKAEKERFHMKKVYSASAGLRYKVLAVKPGFPVGTDEDGKTVTADPASAINFRSILQDKDPYRELRLGCLPRKEGNEIRTLNMITMPQHVLWEDASLRTREGMRKYLEEIFPCSPALYPPIDSVVEDVSSALVQALQLEAFARSPGGAFPRPQTTKSGVAWAAPGESPTGEVGVVLVGDSFHAFPPDLGQGVNSGLKDVATLGNHLCAADKEGAPTKNALSTALQGYEEEASAEAKALVRMMQLGGPYQYGQPGLKGLIGRTFWIFNFLTRMALAKLPLLGNRMLHPPIFQLIQRGDKLSYRAMLAMAHQTTATIWAMILSVVALVMSATGMLPLPF